MPKIYRVSFQGVDFPTIGAAAKAHGLPYHTLSARLRLGWPIDRALTTPPQRRHLTVAGETFTVAQAAKRFGLYEHSIRNRLARGESDTEAVEARRRPGRRSDSPHAHHSGKSIKQRLAALRDQLKDKPCADCEQKFHLHAMEFDHRSDKAGVVGKMRTFKGMIAEAAKCDVVCANCHRIRTHTRRLLAAFPD